MPTAGRLVGAVCFGILGAYLALLSMPFFEEGKIPSFWWPLCIISGLWAGWVIVGKRAGRGYSAGIGNGLTGAAGQVFWIVFIVAFVDMVLKSMRKSYDGPLEAVINVFQLAIDHAVNLGRPDVITGILVGGIIGGLITEFFGRRFP